MEIQTPPFPFTFETTACESCPGNCCTGESGNIWVTENEISQIATELELDIDTFIQRYTRRVRHKFSLIEKPWKQGEFACIFFEDGCSIYNQRPKQCRTFPFWPRYQKNHLDELQRECPGVQLLKESHS